MIDSRVEWVTPVLVSVWSPLLCPQGMRTFVKSWATFCSHVHAESSLFSAVTDFWEYSPDMWVFILRCNGSEVGRWLASIQTSGAGIWPPWLDRVVEPTVELAIMHTMWNAFSNPCTNCFCSPWLVPCSHCCRSEDLHFVREPWWLGIVVAGGFLLLLLPDIVLFCKECSVPTRNWTFLPTLLSRTCGTASLASIPESSLGIRSWPMSS